MSTYEREYPWFLKERWGSHTPLAFPSLLYACLIYASHLGHLRAAAFGGGEEIMQNLRYTLGCVELSKVTITQFLYTFTFTIAVFSA